jgi:hypothetical protein
LNLRLRAARVGYRAVGYRAVGRLPWLAAFFLRERRLRAFFAM